MHITFFTKIFLLSGLLLSNSLYANEVFQWKNAQGSNSYSDVPNNLRPSQSTVINVRTHKVVPPATTTVAPESSMVNGEPSLAEQQRVLNDQIARQNSNIEKKNKEAEEQNRKTQEANCKTARMNRSFAESSRSTNRAALMQRYDADIAQFCN